MEINEIITSSKLFVLIPDTLYSISECKDRFGSENVFLFPEITFSDLSKFPFVPFHKFRESEGKRNDKIGRAHV